MRELAAAVSHLARKPFDPSSRNKHEKKEKEGEGESSDIGSGPVILGESSPSGNFQNFTASARVLSILRKWID